MIRLSVKLVARTLRRDRSLARSRGGRLECFSSSTFLTDKKITSSTTTSSTLPAPGSRSFSAAAGGEEEKPKVPSTASSELAPIGDGNNNLPAKLIDFQASAKIEGEESMIATIELRPGETLRAEAGNMLYMTEGIVMDTNLSGASSAFARMMTGQNMFLTDFKYEGNKGAGTMALGTDFPSKIMRFSLDDFDGNSLICQRGAYLASNATVNIEMEFTKTLTAGFFGGQGFVLQRLSGQGDVLVKGGGTIVARELEAGGT